MTLTLRQRILKIVYPLFMLAKGRRSKPALISNRQHIYPLTSFYSLSVTLNDGKELPFENLKGKKILLVNTASDCGFTPQYAELQKLYEQVKDDVEIIGIPANDFKEQEKGSDEEIAAFCSRNYGVSFPIARKTTVVKQSDQHPVFRWLSTKTLNGWNEKAPSWNFSKYLINEEGVLTHYFGPAISPLSDEVIKAIHP